MKRRRNVSHKSSLCARKSYRSVNRNFCTNRSTMNTVSKSRLEQFMEYASRCKCHVYTHLPAARRTQISLNAEAINHSAALHWSACRGEYAGNWPRFLFFRTQSNLAKWPVALVRARLGTLLENTSAHVCTRLARPEYGPLDSPTSPS